MAWLELSLSVDQTQQADVESALEALGALAVSLADADVDTPDEHAIFEPGVGETPVWQRTSLQGLFAADVDRTALILGLIARLPGIRPADIGFREVADQDWERVWMDRFKPMPFGRRLWVYPWNIEPPADAALAIVRLDPGLAFGTGTHPTTALCLAWLDGLDLAGKTLLDYGCGSGVLAVAALKLGAAHAVGIDNDPQALTASRDNAQRNGVAAHLDVYLPAACPAAPADVLVANILAGPLGELAPRFASLCKPDAPFAISGILNGQQNELIARFEPWFETLTVTTREDWIRIDGHRKRA